MHKWFRARLDLSQHWDRDLASALQFQGSCSNPVLLTNHMIACGKSTRGRRENALERAYIRSAQIPLFRT